MTVAALPATVTYAEDGVSIRFPVPFRYVSAVDLLVERILPGGDVQQLQLGADYRVEGGDTDAGGLLTRTVATAGARLRIRRQTSRAQTMSYATGDRFPASSHEQALDRGILISQEQDVALDDVVRRSPLVPDGETAPSLPSRQARKNRLLGFDAAGDGVAVSGGGADGTLRDDLAIAGSQLVNFDGRTVAAKLKDVKSVRDAVFAGGAKGDGIADDTAAINAALASGGRISFPRGTYKISDRLLVTVSRTEITMEAGVTITGNPWRYPGGQVPFGSLILVTAKDCSIRGAGMGSTLIQLTGGSEANGVTFLHCDGGYLGYLTIDGGKDSATAISDDTFQTGVSTLNASAPNSNPSLTPSRVIVEKVEARNFVQYGMQAYGDLAATLFQDCIVQGNGIGNQALSVGCGFAITRGNRNVIITRCRILGNKQHGILQSSAGLASYSLSFTDNEISGNGGWGISLTEQTNYASASGVGTNGVTLASNRIRANGQGPYGSKGGILAGTYDGIGQMFNVSSTGDLIQDNQGFGFLVQTNDNPTNQTSRISIDSTIIGNTIGLGIGSKCDDTIRWNGTKIRNNTTDISNSGDSRYVSNSRGYGGSVASAPTITLPKDGDSFTLTGNATITNISADEGRIVTLVFGGSVTIANTGNVVMASSFAGAGNSTIQLVSRANSWFQIARSANV